MPATTIKATTPSAHGPDETHTFTGVLLADLLAKVGLRSTDERAKLGTSVSVTASDQHWVTFSLAELDPQLGNASALIAYQQDGHLLDTSGMAELIVPSDKQVGRSVENIISVYVYYPFPASHG